MRIVVHDFGGYPYPIELSRALAHRGHAVTHVYCASLQTTPGGAFVRRPDDPPSFEIVPIRLARPLNKFSFLKRFLQENEYGRRAAKAIVDARPDVVISANTPLDAQRTIQRVCRRHGIPLVFWVQDLLGVAAERILRRKLGLIGRVIGGYYLNLERRLLRAADEVVVLTDDFVPLMHEWDVPDERLTVIENWAPLADLPTRPKANAWSEEAGLAEDFCFIYAGTLAMKHNPGLLLALARRVESRNDVRLVVLSQGPGADWLREQKQELGLNGLIIRGFEPFDRMPDVMATADVLVAVLEEDAGVFSVPSKVLAYLCAERALLLSVPLENLAARIVSQNAAGHVVPPDDIDGFVAAAEELLEDQALRKSMGARARHYAQRTFDIDTISDRFSRVIARAAGLEFESSVTKDARQI